MRRKGISGQTREVDEEQDADFIRMRMRVIVPDEGAESVTRDHS
jgi:hypothetical protein